MRSSLRLCLAAGGLALVQPVAVLAQEAEGTVVLDEITLTGQQKRAAPGEGRVTATQLATEYQGAGLDTVLRGMAGVTTQGGLAEGGETAINIRGLQDQGRVAVTIDGMRQNFARSGHGANGSFALDSEMLREVAVTRGPGGMPGAIAGSVAMRSVSAEDLLPEDGGTSGGELRLRHGTLSASPTLHAAYATRFGEAMDLTVAATRAEQDDYEAPDGTMVYARQLTRNGLATLGWTMQDGQRLTLGATRLAKDYMTGRSSGAPRDTDLRTDSLSLGYEAPDLAGWTVEGQIYDTGTSIRQQPLNAALNPVGLPRSYETGTQGLRLEGRRTAEFAGRTHELRLTLEGFRDKVTTDDPTGGSLTPSGEREFWSLAAEDRMAFGAATVTFGLSADRYALDSTAAASSGRAISPRLALELPFGAGFTLHAGAALTYRPPTLNESLVDGSHPEPADFDIKPNPDLQPERARNIELGLGYAADGLFAEGDLFEARVTVFRNQIDDYIGLRRVGGLFGGYYQYDNIDKVRIEGLELEASYEAGRFFGSLSGQIMDGKDLTTGGELSRAAPDRLVLTLGLRNDDDTREFGARLTSVGAKSAGDLQSKSWKTVDLFFRQDLTETASFGLALNNIFDETYIPHLETQPSPGVNAQASLIFRF